jgi:outer membrane protein assembly factor BamB
MIVEGLALAPYRSYTALRPPKVDYLVAYDLQTGARKWALNGDVSVFTTPAVAGGRVYFGYVQGYLSQTEVRAVRLADGELLWKQGFAPYVAASSPVVDGDRVLLGMGDGALYSLRLDTGQVAGRLALAWRIYSSAAVTDAHAFIGASDGKLYCVGE